MALFDWFASADQLYQLLNGTTTINQYAYQFLWIEIPIFAILLISIFGGILFVCVAQRQKVFCKDFKYVETTAKARCISLFGAILVGLFAIAAAAIGISFLPNFWQGLKQSNCYLSKTVSVLHEGKDTQCLDNWIGINSLQDYITEVNTSYNNTIQPSLQFINNYQTIAQTSIDGILTAINFILNSFNSTYVYSPMSGAEIQTRYIQVI